MPKFSYQAITDTGSTTTGTLEAESRDAATAAISARGLIPTRVTAERKGVGGLAAIEMALTPVRAWDLILFSKQLGTMLRAGIPIVKLFQILEQQTENRKLKGIIIQMGQDIQEGSSIYDAFRKHPGAFSDMYTSMIHAGESGGSLPEVLDRLIYVIEHEFKVKKEIKGALTYPIMVVVALTVAFLVLLTFVVPKFVKVFEAAKIEIPWPTQVCVLLYTFLTKYWFVALGLTAAIVVSLYLYLKTEQGRYVRDTLLARVPLIGSLFIKAAMSRFASIFSILQSSGVSILDIVSVLSGTIGNAAIARVFDSLGEKLREGRGIADPLRSAPYFTPMVVNMIAIGEESGNLEEMLREVSKHYDAEVEYATGRLAAAIGPILVVGLAAVVGFFALAIYLPMWDLTKMVH
jgi:type IV pilus assembly protein PilC